MKKISILSAAVLGFALAGCAAQQYQSPYMNTPAKLAAVLQKAEAGDVEAQTRACTSGIGNKIYKPADSGDRMCARAASQGSIEAMLDMSARYEIGIDRAIDDKKALQWLKRAAAVQPKKDDDLAETYAGDAAAKLAEMYQYGLMGVAPDQRAAARWHLKAAQYFHTPSFVVLARMYEGGTGVTQNFAQAAKWYRNAARIGAWEGAHGLALLYLRGMGVPRDVAQAYYWESLSRHRLRAKSNTPRPDGVYIDMIAMDRLTTGQQLEIDARVSDWKPDFSGF